MNRDTDFTIDDILDGSTLFETVRQYADSINPQPDTSTTLSSLRFIKIPTNFQVSDDSEIIFEITETGDYPKGTDYIAVSYCWNSFSHHNDGINRSILVLDRDVTRKPRCSTQVLLRAAKFASWSSVSFVWIDQECIDQTDDEDIQKHLQCMHQIFKNAKASIGLLNFEITSHAQFMGLVALAAIDAFPDQVWTDVERRPDFLLDHKRIEFSTRLLRSIHKDRWFSRTWVFQERISGFTNMYLLFMISPKLRVQLISKYPQHFNSSYSNQHLKLKSLVANPALWLHKLQEFELETPELRKALETLHIASENVAATVSGLTLTDVMDCILNKRTIPGRKRPMDGFHVKSSFDSIEACDNEIVSDRIAILSNITDVSYRINTNGKSSYSISLLILLLINGFVPGILLKTNRAEDDSNHPLVTYTSIGDIATWVTDLGVQMYAGELKQQANSALYQDFMTTTRALLHLFPNRWDGIVTGDLSILEAELENSTPSGLKRVLVVPLDATIQDIMNGIIKFTSKKRECLTHEDGRHILRYAVESGQVPQDADFVSFYGKYCWRNEFIEQHFQT